MTLDQFVTKYDGEVVADGQCGNLVRQYWIDVDNTSPPSYTNSKDYWSSPVPGYDKITSNPQPGNIAIYDGHGIYTEGHSAIYIGNGQVFEQNADPNGSPAHRYSRANTYLLGYLRKQGKDKPMPEINAIAPSAKEIDDLINQVRILAGFPDSELNGMLTTYRPLLKNNVVAGAATVLDMCINNPNSARNKPTGDVQAYSGPQLYVKS